MFALLTQPITPLVLIVVVILLALTLFISVKQEVSRLRRQLREQTAEMSSLQQRAVAQEAQFAVAMQHIKETPTLPVPAPASGPLSSINLTKRSQAMRRIRRGEQPEEIATALQLPRNEVRLLLKMQGMILGGQVEA